MLHAHQENLKSLAFRTLNLNRPHIARNAADQNFPLEFTQIYDPPEQYLLHRESFAGRTLAYRKASVIRKERRIAVMKENWDAPNHGEVYADVLAYLDALSFLQLEEV